jgi:hypothetical protein
VSAGKGKRARKRKARAERPVPSIEGLAAFLKMADEGAFVRPQNSLCVHGKPLEILQACCELARGQHALTFRNVDRIGDEHIWCMLFHALRSVHADFTLLDKHARRCVGWESGDEVQVAARQRLQP